MQKEKIKTAGVVGFTLIELLVVMAIISMLLSILMPALNGAKEQARRVVCLSNLKQLTFAWHMYAMENDDELCPPEAGGTYSWGEGFGIDNVSGSELSIKKGLLWPYTKSLKLYECQSAESYRSIHSRPQRLRDYSISRTMGSRMISWEGKPFRRFKTLGDISGPSGKMVFIGADGSYGYNVGMGSFAQGGHLLKAFWPFSSDSTFTTWEFLRLPHDYIMSWNIITARHNNGCNLSFADGHCEYWKYKDRRTVRLAIEATDRQDEIDASVDNADLGYMVELLKGP